MLAGVVLFEDGVGDGAEIGGEGLASHAVWPTWDPAFTKADEVELAVQVNGKVRARLRVSADASPEHVLAEAKALDNVRSHLEGKTLRKEMVVPGRLVVIVAN